jgi:hypothetical protein
MVDPAKEYSTHSNGLEVYMECVVLLCSMVIKESLKINVRSCRFYLNLLIIINTIILIIKKKKTEIVTC